jgi:hypothetical protein
MRMMERVNSTTIYCKNFCKCHNVPQYNNNNNDNKDYVPWPGTESDVVQVLCYLPAPCRVRQSTLGTSSQKIPGKGNAPIEFCLLREKDS